MEMFLNQAVLYVVNLDYSKNERNKRFLESLSFGFSIYLQGVFAALESFLLINPAEYP
mgnify:CR=1 FL=1